MTNIYNKVILHPNGTLISNWFEEEELRRRTGEGRTIPGKNFPKRWMDFENPIKNTNPRDDTFKRIIDNEIYTSIVHCIDSSNNVFWAGENYTVSHRLPYATGCRYKFI